VQRMRTATISPAANQPVAHAAENVVYLQIQEIMKEQDQKQQLTVILGKGEEGNNYLPSQDFKQKMRLTSR
jgi:hypothetical protein